MTDKPVFCFQINWRVTAFTLCLLPGLIALGAWQVQRADEKRATEALYETRRSAIPVSLNELASDELPTKYAAVVVQGAYDNTRHFLVDNRVYNGKVGFDVISPFKIAGSEQTVLVNRGWLVGSLYRSTLPLVPKIIGQKTLFAEVWMPGSLGNVAQSVANGWPRIVQQVNIQEMGYQLETGLLPITLRLQASAPGALQPNWAPINMNPQKHMGYAFQWFIMAAVLAVIWLLSNTNILLATGLKHLSEEETP